MLLFIKNMHNDTKNAQQTKTMTQKPKSLRQKIRNSSAKQRIASSMFAVLLLLGFVSMPIVSAQNYQQQINDLRDQNSEIKEDVGELEDEASSLEDKIGRLQQRINNIQAQINDNRDKIEELNKRVVEAEAELDKQRGLLGANIRTMYLEGDVSTLEMLASSKDLSEFVDKEQYRTAVQNKIKTTLDTITTLKHELNTKKETVQQRVVEQQSLNADLGAKRAENNQLLSLNEGEQAKLDSKIKKTNKRIEELKRLQAVENMRLFGGGAGTIGGGGYPWGRAKCIHTGQVDGWCSNYDWAVGGSIWNFSTGGYGYRNCTDWVSFRVRSTGKFVPSGMGNANNWDDRAPGKGFKVSSTPKAGAAAVSNGGYYGHVMYVEAVNSDGSIVISDYNRAGTGKYATSTVSASGLRFVYF